MEITTVNMPQATPKNTQTAPAGPPFRRASVPVLIRPVNLIFVPAHVEQRRAYIRAKGHVKPTIAA
jgi:hypothetical protein